MMTEKQFVESQKECASMLGMSLSEYQKYCKNLKVPKQKDVSDKHDDGNTNDILKFLKIDKNLLKIRKDS